MPGKFDVSLTLREKAFFWTAHKNNYIFSYFQILIYLIYFRGEKTIVLPWFMNGY